MSSDSLQTQRFCLLSSLLICNVNLTCTFLRDYNIHVVRLTPIKKVDGEFLFCLWLSSDEQFSELSDLKLIQLYD